MTNEADTKRPTPATGRGKGHGLRRFTTTAALIGACAIGAGATALAHRGRDVSFVALAPAPIGAMTDGSPVAIKGQVAEIFGGKFTIGDDSGRALVETGSRGEGGHLVSAAETVTVQGRFEHGFVHAAAIQHADGRTDLVGPPAPPPIGPQGAVPPRPAAGPAER